MNWVGCYGTDGLLVACWWPGLLVARVAHKDIKISRSSFTMACASSSSTFLFDILRSGKS